MKKIKRHSIIIFCLMCLLTLSVACTEKDADTGDGIGDTTRVPINLKAVGGNLLSDKEIKTIRLIFFTPSGKLISNWLYNIQPGENPSVVTGEMTIGMNDIYVVCNETAELSKDLANVTRPEQIASIKFTPPIDGITDPVPMYCHLPDVLLERGKGTSVNVTIGGVTKPYLEATVKRIVARIGMTVIKNIPTNEMNFSIEKLSYRICHVPAYSMLVENDTKYPQGAGWGEDIKVIGQGRIAESSNGDYVVNGDLISTNPTNLDAIHCPAVYIPEHKPIAPENPNYCTYLLIDAECVTDNSATPIHTIYRVNIGKLPPTDLSLERNVNYQIYLKITGLGATGFYANIVPVEEYDLPVTWKPTQGYAIVGEEVEDYGVNKNIWNSYSQYSGILKVVNDKTYSDVCFRYGSVIALSSTSTAGAFNPATDVLWIPEVTKKTSPVTSWNDVGYMTSEDVSGTTHTLENIKLGKGDPCRLVGLSESEISSGKVNNELWRLPTEAEMQWLINAQNYTADARGHYSFSSLLTPYNGYRSETGEMVPSSTTGNYWSATAATAFLFSTSNTTIATDNPMKAYAVRCIRTDIPESVFNVNDVIVDYLGATREITYAMNNVLTPYWRMEIADAASEAQISISKREGSTKEKNLVTVKPLPKPYESGMYYINATGYGIDGRIFNRTVSVTQNSLLHDVAIAWTSVPSLQESEGYFRIPVEGATLSFTMQITPEPLEPYNPGFDDQLWRIECQYYTDKLNTVYGTPAKRGEASVITFAKNDRNHILGMEFKMVPVSSITYPPYHTDVTLIIQNER